jgi:hypothetical protein
VARCGSCRTLLHRECRAALGRCPTLGCRSTRFRRAAGLRLAKILAGAIFALVGIVAVVASNPHVRMLVAAWSLEDSEVEGPYDHSSFVIHGPSVFNELGPDCLPFLLPRAREEGREDRTSVYRLLVLRFADPDGAAERWGLTASPEVIDVVADSLRSRHARLRYAALTRLLARDPRLIEALVDYIERLSRTAERDDVGWSLARKALSSISPPHWDSLAADARACRAWLEQNRARLPEQIRLAR